MLLVVVPMVRPGQTMKDLLCPSPLQVGLQEIVFRKNKILERPDGFRQEGRPFSMFALSWVEYSSLPV